MPLKVRGPSLPSDSVPASAFERATSSSIDFIGDDGFDQHRERAARDERHRHEVLLRVVGQRLEQHTALVTSAAVVAK